MPKVIEKHNIVGKTFNNIMITNLLGKSRGHIYVECVCKCGKVFKAIYNNLQKGNTKSCGCRIGQRLIKYMPKSGRFYINGALHNYVGANGYQVITYNGKRVYAHRLAWKMYYGKFPLTGLDIDHINRNKQDNRISNLRMVTRSENLKNRDNSGISFVGKESEALDMYSSGKTCTEIADQLGTDRHYISKYLKSLGIEVKKGFAVTKKR